ncbi:MAG: hypothetical protein K2K84_00660 [Muribaculaceae bacterium]|nr:hypothetical protein [Muribaculaceae bacterium]
MGKILSVIFLTLTMLVSVSVQSCSTSGCTELRSATPRADFYSALTGDAIALDSISVSGVGVHGDSILVTAGKTVSQVYLPMPPKTDTVSWHFGYHWKVLADYDITDTVTIMYTRQPWFAGEECGAMYRYHINNVIYTENLIDSVTVPDSLVTNIDRATLNIYFHVETAKP